LFSVHSCGSSDISSGHCRAPCNTRKIRTVVAIDSISGDVGCAVNNQLPRSRDAARSAPLRVPRQSPDRRPDAVIHGDRGLWAVFLDVVENRVAIRLRKDGPLQPHGLSHLAQRGGSALGEVRFDLFVRDAGT
jgi:hypothetical protein